MGNSKLCCGVRSSRSVRAGLIVLATVGIVSFAVFETGAVSRVAGLSGMWAPRSATLNVPTLAGAKLLRSYDATFNGEKSVFAHYASKLSPQQVVEQYKQVASAPGCKLLAPVPGAEARGRSQAMIGYMDSDGSTVGIVAFENKGGGSTYFVGRSKADRKPLAGGDVPGREPPDVPKPLRSSRLMCVENLAGLPSILSLYEGWGETEDTIDLMRTKMTGSGWQRNADVEDVVGQELGGKLLSYARGVESCLVHLERDPRSNHVTTMMFYCQKPWLPEGKSF
jgi:hypothetical protein